MDNSAQSSPNSDGESGPNVFKDTLSVYTKNAISAITQVYSMANQGYAFGYANGRQAAYEDVFKWFTDKHDSTMRYVSAVSFFNYINDRLIEVKSKFVRGKFLMNSNI